MRTRMRPLAWALLGAGVALGSIWLTLPHTAVEAGVQSVIPLSQRAEPDVHVDASYTVTVFTEVLTTTATARSWWTDLSVMNDNADDIEVSLDGGTTVHARVPAAGELEMSTRPFQTVDLRLESGGTGGAKIIVNVQ